VGFEYVSVEEAIGRDGLRMVVVGGVPSPWGEAAKGLFHIKGIDWVGVRLAYDSEALLQWAGERSGPVAVYGKERRAPAGARSCCSPSGSRPSPRSCRRDRRARERGARARGAICDQRRPQLDPPAAARARRAAGPARLQRPRSTYLAKKYGHDPRGGAAAGAKVADILGGSRRA
jgi:hypothetical protein